MGRRDVSVRTEVAAARSSTGPPGEKSENTLEGKGEERENNGRSRVSSWCMIWAVC